MKESPEKSFIGEIMINSSPSFVHLVYFIDKPVMQKQETFATKKAYSQLADYLSGKRFIFDVNIELKGTSFQIKVWNELLNVPYGAVATYQDIANKIGMPNAVRAVAGAIAKNPLAIFVPCHRIIRKDGKIGGYRWGIERKKALLELEKTHLH